MEIEWIKVTDKLPNDPTIEPLYLFDGYTRITGWYSNGKFYSFLGKGEWHPTYWMRLPEPPTTL